MNKTLTFVFGVIATIIFLSGCKNELTMQERIQKEKKAIERYIERNHLVILDEYPEGGKFGEKDYFKTADGLYFHVVDSGNGKRASLYMDEIAVRFEYLHYISETDTSLVYWNTLTYDLPYTYKYGDDTSVTYTERVYPISFKYGLSQTYSISGSLVCSGFVIPLEYVGEHAVIDMIIPSSIGSYSDQSSFYPVFYKGIVYSNFY
jgi:hypothetical protein